MIKHNALLFEVCFVATGFREGAGRPATSSSGSVL